MLRTGRPVSCSAPVRLARWSVLSLRTVETILLGHGPEASAQCLAGVAGRLLCVVHPPVCDDSSHCPRHCCHQFRVWRVRWGVKSCAFLTDCGDQAGGHGLAFLPVPCFVLWSHCHETTRAVPREREAGAGQVPGKQARAGRLRPRHRPHCACTCPVSAREEGASSQERRHDTRLLRE